MSREASLEPPAFCGHCGKKTKVADRPWKYDVKTGAPIITRIRKCTRWFCGWMWWSTDGRAYTGYDGVY